jgi:AcrR family transcriptional regulator
MNDHLAENTRPRPRRLQQRALEKRARILDAAGQVFPEKDYGGARLADIVLAAETIKGTFCDHFRNKLEVAKAIMFHSFTVSLRWRASIARG